MTTEINTKGPILTHGVAMLTLKVCSKCFEWSHCWIRAYLSET